MTTVSQRIPNFLGGISQQPDYLKFPGQLVDSVNTYPDYALGLLKRPGGKFSAELYNATTSGRWFSILRDDQEKYVAQYSENRFKVWSLLDGSPKAVDMGTTTGVPGTCNVATLKTRLSDYNTAVTTKATRLSELNTAQANYQEALIGQNASVSNLFEIDTSYPYGDVTQSVTSGIVWNTNVTTNPYTIKENGTVVGSYANTSAFPAGYSLGNERSDDYPILKREGFKIYELDKSVAATHTAGQLATALSAMNTAQTNYNTAVSDLATKKGLYDTAVSNCNITTVPSNAYLKDTTADDIEVLTLNDYTFVLNKNKVPAMKATLSASIPYQAFVVVNVVAYNANYTIRLNSTNYTKTTPQDVSGGTTDAASIASSLATSINGSAGFTAVAVGPGVYITNSSSFTLQTAGSGAEQGLFGFLDQVSTVGKLPVQCKDGYKVQISNSTNLDADNMWVEFQTTNNASYGPGVWVESIAPGIKYIVDELTMPHQLVRQTDGSFKYEPIVWEDRTIGDNETNPTPSFIDTGVPINNLFFYRNRFGFICGDTIFLSKAGDYFNLFGTTAQTVSDDDPIDVIASSTKPVSLSNVVTTSAGLILFSQNEQFLLNTEETGPLTPRSVSVQTLSSYECDGDLTPQALGTTVLFAAKTALYTRLFEKGRISTGNPPLIAEISTYVSEFVPSTVSSMIASPALSLISLATPGSSTVYQYRSYTTGEERRSSTWYKWELTGTLLDQFFDESTYYAVVVNGAKVSVNSYDLTQASEEGFLTLPTGERTDVCLDMFTINPYRTYNSGTDQTTIYLPYDHLTGKTLAVMALGGLIGSSSTSLNTSVAAVLYPTVQGSTGAYYVVIDGDYRGKDVILGYIYTMTVELPKLYLGSADSNIYVSDTTADLIIQRIKVQTGLGGPVTYQIDITGREEWINVVNVTLPSLYVLNNVNLSAEDTHTVPIYQRNKNTRIKIIGDTPFPVTLRKLDWEGKYNNRFYRRK